MISSLKLSKCFAGFRGKAGALVQFCERMRVAILRGWCVRRVQIWVDLSSPVICESNFAFQLVHESEDVASRLFLKGRDSSKKILCHANQHPGVAAIMETLMVTPHEHCFPSCMLFVRMCAPSRWCLGTNFVGDELTVAVSHLGGAFVYTFTCF